MKILMIPSFFKNYRNESLGVFFLEQALALQSIGHEVTILYADTYSIKYFMDFLKYKENSENINKVKIIRCRKFSPFKHGNFNNKKAFSKACLKLCQKSQISFDIIHAQNSIWAGEAARVISKKYNIPYVITEHSSWFALSNNNAKNKFQNDLELIFHDCSKLICVSRQLQNDLIKYYNKPCIIGNVVDTDTFNISSFEKSNVFTFVCLAFLQNEHRINLKGIKELLISFKKIVEIYDNIKLKIIGVSSNSILYDIINDYKIDGNVELLPVLDKKKIAIEMNKSNCFILLSNYETFGLAYAEAMACGLPIIATNVGIVSEIVDEKNGIICNKNNIKSIVEAMDYVINNIKKYNSKDIRKNIVGKYSKKIIANQIEKVYRSVLENVKEKDK